MALPAIEAFEAEIIDLLDHKAFTDFGSVTVDRVDVERWKDTWALDELTRAEMSVMADMLAGSHAPTERRTGVALMIDAVRHTGNEEVNLVRRLMAGGSPDYQPTDTLGEAQAKWRRVQVRQVFRLSLECLFSWIITRLDGGPLTTDQLVEEALADWSPPQSWTKNSDWFGSWQQVDGDPTVHLDNIQNAMLNAAGSDQIQGGVRWIMKARCSRSLRQNAEIAGLRLSF